MYLLCIASHLTERLTIFDTPTMREIQDNIVKISKVLHRKLYGTFIEMFIMAYWPIYANLLPHSIDQIH